ncbi:MAG: hypothetical protein AAFR18_19925 [Cyanobacteria bacterium J06627_32]
MGASVGEFEIGWLRGVWTHPVAPNFLLGHPSRGDFYWLCGVMGLGAIAFILLA